LKQWLDSWQRRLTERYGTDISTPEARKAARRHFLFVDHGWLRILWRNFAEIAPEVYRSNQPSPKDLRAIHERVGLKSVLNLRGVSRQSFYLFEKEECEALGLRLVDISLSATKAPSRSHLLHLIKLLEDIPKPVLIHCKSGADRTGLAAAIYLLVHANRPIAEAKRQLSLKFVHVKNSAAGIQDHLLRAYEQDHAKTGIGFVDWVTTEYDPVALTASFARWRAGERSLP